MTGRKTNAVALTALTTAALSATATATVWLKRRLRALASFSG